MGRICALLYVITLLAPLHAASAATITQDFNTPGQLAKFTQFIAMNESPASTGGIAESTTGGVSNSGSLSLGTTTSTDETLSYGQQGFDFSTTGQTITESLIFKMPATLTNGSGARIQLGFLTIPGTGYNNNPNEPANTFPAFTSVRVTFPSTNSNVAQLQGQQKVAGNSSTGAATFFTSSNAALSPNEYYVVEMTATQQGGGDYSIVGDITDEGSNGTTPGAIVLSMPRQTQTGFSDLATTVYGGIRQANSLVGINIDNFSITGQPVPEPVSLGITCVGAIGFLARRRPRCRD